MLAVHALWSPGRGVVLWAEDGERPARGGSRPLRSAAPHPFAAPAAALADVHPGKPTVVTLLLPAQGHGPVGSPELVRAAHRTSRAEVRLRPWSVPALVVDAAELADPADEVRYGASVVHLRAVAELAADLAARGRVLPTVVRDGAAAFARWRPVVQGLDEVAFDALVDAMPPVGRAEHAGAGGPVGRDPAALLTDALAVLTDTAVRDRLARADTPVALVPPRRSRPTATEAWLSALLTPDARIDADGRAVDTLVTELAAWDGFGTAPAGEARASLRLVEARTLHDPSDPGDDPHDQTGDGTRWQLEFFLQSTADPSLLVPAAQVWSGAAGRIIAEPQELLLGELGRAAHVWPPLAPALRGARPEVLELAAGGAHEFLTSGAALLVEAGFGVQLPAGWDGSRGLGLRLSVRSTPTDTAVVRGGLGREELADFRWSIAVGDEILGEDELAELVAAKAPLVRLRGLWVSVDADRLRSGLEFLRRARSRRTPATAAEVLALLQRHPADSDTPLPVTSVRADGWLGDLLDGAAERTLQPIATPPGFTAELRPYQRRGVAWLAFLSSLGLGACLADDMGLGKTVQLLALEAHERASGDGARRFCSAPCRSSAPGSARPPGSRPACGCTSITARTGRAATHWPRRSPPPTWSSPPTPPPPATPTRWPPSGGGAWCSTRPRR